jgi:hypothetical protein
VSTFRSSASTVSVRTNNFHQATGCTTDRGFSSHQRQKVFYSTDRWKSYWVDIGVQMLRHVTVHSQMGLSWPSFQLNNHSQIQLHGIVLITGLQPQNPCHFAWQLSEWVSQASRPPTSVTWLQLLRKQTNTGTSATLTAQEHWSTCILIRALYRPVTHQHFLRLKLETLWNSSWYTPLCYLLNFSANISTTMRRSIYRVSCISSHDLCTSASSGKCWAVPSNRRHLSPSTLWPTRLSFTFTLTSRSIAINIHHARILTHPQNSPSFPTQFTMHASI